LALYFSLLALYFSLSAHYISLSAHYISLSAICDSKLHEPDSSLSLWERAGVKVLRSAGDSIQHATLREFHGAANRTRVLTYTFNMSAPDAPKHLAAYHEALKDHGPSFATTLWRSREAQVLRFDVMIGLVDFASMRILDAGCGLGDFAARLHERHIEFTHFLGLDALPEMVAAASARNLTRSDFRACDFATELSVFAEVEHDYAVFSGSLNTMMEDHARQVIAEAFKHARRGVVFNFLSNKPAAKWLDKDLGPASRFDTAAWITWALEQTPQVAFEQRYLEGHDATVVMERE